METTAQLPECAKEELTELILDYANEVRTGYLSDELNDYADSLVPVYNSEIIKEWTELDYDEMDGGAEYASPEDTILRRMMYDLYNFYQSQVGYHAQQIAEQMGIDLEEYN